MMPPKRCRIVYAHATVAGIRWWFQAVVRSLLRASGGGGDGGGSAAGREAITVTLLPGAYFNTSIVFGNRDSPGPGGSVVWRAGTGGHREQLAGEAVLYGGARITSWSRVQAGSPIWQATLPPELLDSAGRAVFHTLVQDDRACWLARVPDYGSGFLPCPGTNSEFTCAPGVLPDDIDCTNSSCTVFTRAGYSSDIRAVTSVDATGQTVSFESVATDQSRGHYYLQGALELLDAEGEWAVRHGVLYFWPYGGASPNLAVVTAPARQRVVSFVGADRGAPVTGITVAGLAIVGAAMPGRYVYACGTGPGTSGAPCAADGGPDTPDETNTSPRASSQGMVYLENATGIAIWNW